MAKRTLKELNLMDDFLFGTMMSYPGIGDEFGRTLLKIIFGREFERIHVVPQKVYYGSDTTLHGARLDVYLEEVKDADELIQQATVYDVEVEQKYTIEERKNISKRVRFYHAKIDAGSLESGESYKNLKNVIVIMIMPFDPFDMNRMVYTIRNSCEEEPQMKYDDGARTIFLYTKGKNGNPPEELRKLLNYMEHSTRENAVGEELARLHKMVEDVKRNQEVSVSYMKIFEREEMIREEGRREERKRAEAAEERAEAAEGRAREEQRNTEKERQRAEAAEEEIRRLRALLDMKS